MRCVTTTNMGKPLSISESWYTKLTASPSALSWRMTIRYPVTEVEPFLIYICITLLNYVLISFAPNTSGEIQPSPW